MRYIFNVVLLCVAFFSCANAQDLLYMKNHDTKKVKVVRISRSRISYKDYNDSTGRVYRLAKDDLSHLVYEDGRLEVYSRLDESGCFSIDDYWRFVGQFACDSLQRCSYKRGDFYYMGNKLTEREIDYAMRNCCPGSRDLYRSGRHIRFWGIMASSMGSYVLQMVLPFYLDDNDGSLVVCAIGTGFVMVGVPLWVVGQRRVQRALDMVGEKCSNSTASQEPIHLDFVPKDKGLGLSLKF